MNRQKRMLSFVLALVMLVLAAPVHGIVFAEGSEQLVIYHENQPISSLILENGSKESLEARGMPVSASYCWEIQLPDTHGWTVISGMNSARCEVSAAVLRGMLDMIDRAAVRCQAILDGQSVVSDPVFIVLNEEEEKTVSASRAPVRRKASSSRTDGLVTITIQYLLPSGKDAASPYVATLPVGQSFNATIPSPSIPGYAPFCIVDGEEQPAPTVSLAYTELLEDQTVVVQYRAVKTTYRVRYFLQNVSDDRYTEDTTRARTGVAVTGTYPKDDIEIQIDGFTCLIHEPDTVAADGSTEFYVYYDRNYYLYQFDCDGGFGVDPVYARYGTPLVVRTPEKAGYAFLGWIKAGESSMQTLPAVIGFENAGFQAQWEAKETTFTVVYWNENPDDAEYTFWASVDVTCQSGTVITAQNLSTADTLIDERPPKELIGNDEFRHYLYNEERTKQMLGDSVTVEGDGSTIINIYYSRRKYTLRFYYARSNEAETQFEVVGGSTWPFGKNNSKKSNNIQELLNEVNDWGWVDKPEFEQSVLDKIQSETNPEGEYRVGFDSYTMQGRTYRYHYIEFTAKYGAYLQDLWMTTARFKPTQIRYANENNGSQYAVFSAWNGEYHVKYNDNENPTIKGRYLRLDDELLYRVANESQYRPPEDGNSVVCFLAFWENGAKIGWANRALKWTYEIYQEPLPIELENLGNDNLTKLQHNPGTPMEFETLDVDGKTPIKRTWIWFDGADQYWNSNDSQHGSKIAGVYYLMPGLTYVCTDNNSPYDINGAGQNGFRQQTPPGTLGYSLYAGKWEQQALDANDKAVYSGTMGYVGRFFFRRDKYTLKLKNYDVWLSSGKEEEGKGYRIKFGRIMQIMLNGILNKKVVEEKDLEQLTDYPENLIQALEPDYPTSLEPGAFQFEGWYTSPKFFEGTAIDEDYKMPATQTTLYAKWVPVSRTVTFSATYDHMLKQEYVNGDILTVEHREQLSTSDIPNWEALKQQLGYGDQYEFIGWFYEDETGARRPFDPGTMQVVADMHLFAEWRSSEIVSHTVHYVEAGSKTSIAADSVGYSYVGTTKTFIAKAGDALYPAYRTGWFPTTNSHSIIAGREAEYTFEYQNIGKVRYTIRYIDDTTGQEFSDDIVKPVVDETDHAVLTVRFEPIAGYVANAFYKTLILSANPDENHIEFHYTKTDTTVRYSVVHRIQQSDGSYADYKLEERTGNSGDLVQVNPISILGYAYSEAVTKEHASKDITVNATGASAKLSQMEALTIALYYTRTEYSYWIQYVDVESGDVLYQEQEEQKALYGDTIKYNAPGTLKDVTLLKNQDWTYELVGSPERTFSVAADNDQVFKIPYRAKTAAIRYVPISLHGSGTGGTVSRSNETNLHVREDIQGSTASEAENYVFQGWFSDAACQTLVSSSQEWKPEILTLDQTVTYYALFEPSRADLTIRKTVSGDESGSDTFLFSIKGVDGTATAGIHITVSIQGSGSAIIKQLPVGTYTVQELTNWSWRYESEEDAIQTIEVVPRLDQTNEVFFTNRKNQMPWLGGEAKADNRFTNNGA